MKELLAKLNNIIGDVRQAELMAKDLQLFGKAKQLHYAKLQLMETVIAIEQDYGEDKCKN